MDKYAAMRLIYLDKLVHIEKICTLFSKDKKGVHQDELESPLLLERSYSRESIDTNLRRWLFWINQ